MMNDLSSPKAPTWFIVVAALALVWNLFGVAMYFAHVMVSPESLAALPPEERALYTSFPDWAVSAFAFAVFAGVAGSIGLLLRKKWAMPALVVSLVGVLVQNAYWLFMSDAPSVYGGEVYFMPALIIVIAIDLVWLARFASRKGWMT